MKPVIGEENISKGQKVTEITSNILDHLRGDGEEEIMDMLSNPFDYLKNFNEEDIARRPKDVRKVKPDSFLGKLFKISNDEE